ncbi:MULTISPECIES: hypothetical protein [unclassified Microcoleus]
MKESIFDSNGGKGAVPLINIALLVDRTPTTAFFHKLLRILIDGAQ